MPEQSQFLLTCRSVGNSIPDRRALDAARQAGRSIMLVSLKRATWRRLGHAGASVASLLIAGAAYAAECPTVGDPQGLAGAYPGQVEVQEAAAAGITPTYSENPLFASDVSAGKLPPVAQRLPEEPLIVLPYESCG